MSHLYLACLDGCLGDPSKPRNSAKHYGGSALDWRAREIEHREGRGARLLAAANARGINWHIAQVYVLPCFADAQIAEHVIKERGHFAARCVRCRALARGEAPPAEPVIIHATLDDFAGNRPLAAIVGRRLSRLKARRDLARWLDAVSAESDATSTGNDEPIRAEDGSTLGTTYGDASTSWPLELVGPDFDLDAWRAGQLDAAAYEANRVRRALRGE